MGSEWNKKHESTRSCYDHQQQLPFCTNGCGNFGLTVSSGMCYRCNLDLYFTRLLKDTEVALSLMPPGRTLFSSVRADSFKSLSRTGFASSSGPALPPMRVSAWAKNYFAYGRELAEQCRPNRCDACNKKIGLATGFECRCGLTCCGAHRYPEAHGCSFDYKASGRDQIVKENPAIKAEKILDRI